MSHFTKVETNMKSMNNLNAAAKALGLKRVDRKEVRGFRGRKTTADAVWEVSPKYDMGAIKNEDGSITLIADWWGTNQTIRGLQERIKQEYAVQTILKKASIMGHQLVKKEQQADGSVVLKIRTTN